MRFRFGHATRLLTVCVCVRACLCLWHDVCVAWPRAVACRQLQLQRGAPYEITQKQESNWKVLRLAVSKLTAWRQLDQGKDEEGWLVGLLGLLALAPPAYVSCACVIRSYTMQVVLGVLRNSEIRWKNVWNCRLRNRNNVHRTIKYYILCIK